MVKGKERELTEEMRKGATPKELFDQALDIFLTQQQNPPTLFTNFVTVFESFRRSERIHHSEYFLDPDKEEPELSIRRLIQGRVAVLAMQMSKGFAETDDDKIRGHLIIEALFKLLVRTGGPYAELVRRGPETEADFLARYHALYDEYMSETI